MSEIMPYRREDLEVVVIGDEELGFACPDCGGVIVLEEETPAGEELYLCYSCFTKFEVIG